MQKIRAAAKVAAYFDYGGRMVMQKQKIVLLNEQAKEYMLKYNRRHIVLNIEEITSWCAPPYKEMSVSFTDEEEAAMLEQGYEAGHSELGAVYYPKEGIKISEHILVKYVEYPWITCWEVEGIEILKGET